MFIGSLITMGIPMFPFPVISHNIISLPSWRLLDLVRWVFDHFESYDSQFCVVVGDLESIGELVNDDFIVRNPKIGLALKGLLSVADGDLLNRKLILWGGDDKEPFHVKHVSVLEADYNAEEVTGVDEILGRILRIERRSGVIKEY